MLVHKATTASTFVPTTVPRTSASVGRGSCWMPTRAPAHVSRLLLIQISYCLIRPMHTNQKGLGRQMGCKIIQRCCFRVSIKRHLLKTIASQPCFSEISADFCPQGHNCQHICVNNVNSYTCQCRTGFMLNADQKTCSRKNIAIAANNFYIFLIMSSHQERRCGTNTFIVHTNQIRMILLMRMMQIRRSSWNIWTFLRVSPDAEFITREKLAVRASNLAQVTREPYSLRFWCESTLQKFLSLKRKIVS